MSHHPDRKIGDLGFDERRYRGKLDIRLLRRLKLGRVAPRLVRQRGVLHGSRSQLGRGRLGLRGET